jgi:hypothetical protein
MLFVQPPHAELLDMRDPGATAKGFPDVCGETPPATFQFIPATGAASALPCCAPRHAQMIPSVASLRMCVSLIHPVLYAAGGSG